MAITILDTSGDQTYSFDDQDYILQDWSGNDIYVFGDGNNEIHDLLGNNEYTLGHGNNKIYLSNGSNIIILGNGNNEIRDYESENHTLTLGNGNNTVFDGRGSSSYTFGDGGNIVQDNEGNDSYVFGDGINSVEDGQGDDEYSLGNGNNSTVDSYGNDTYTFGDGDNTVIDSFGNDSYTLGDGDNDVTDGAGDDYYNIGSRGYDFTWAQNVIRDNSGADEYHIGNSYNWVIGDANNAHNDVFYFYGGTGQINDGAGDDTYYMNDGDYYIIDGSGNDTYHIGWNYDFIGATEIEGGDGDDTYYIKYNWTEIHETSGNNLFVIQSVIPNFINGGVDTDTVDYNASTAAVNIDLLNGTASGGYAEDNLLTSIENIIGTNVGRDYIWGDNNANEIYGMDGHDILQGGGGADYIDGGDGWDYARYTRSAEAVHINMETGVHTGGDAAGDTLINIEAVTGSAFDDTFHGDATINSFYGGNGNDTYFADEGADYFDGQNGSDTVNYAASTQAVKIDLLNGTAEGGLAEGDRLFNIENVTGSDNASVRDYIWGDDNVNEIYGMAGHDILQGGGGADYIDGGAGWDYARYDRSDEAVNINLETGVHTGGDAQGDTLVNIEAVTGSNYDDTFHGDAAVNSFYGGNGDDTYFGDVGSDYFDGQNGFDTVSYINSGSRIIVDMNMTVQNFYVGGVLQNGGDAQGDRLLNIESVYGSNYDDMIYGHISSDNILYGGDGDDNIKGGLGNDIIYGGAGNDILSSSANGNLQYENDHVYGGTGDDIYHFRGGNNHYYETGTDHDIIVFKTTDYALEAIRLDGNTIYASDRGGTEWSVTLNDINLFEEFVIRTDDMGSGFDFYTLAEFQAELVNDYFVATNIAENFVGDFGYDTVDYSASTSGVTINGNNGSGGFAEGDTYNTIDQFIGSNYDDTFHLQYYYTNEFAGNGGNDTFVMYSHYINFNIDGGADFDTVDYTNIGNGTINSVEINLETGETYIAGFGETLTTTYTDIEAFVGTRNNDAFHGDANDNTFYGGNGDDVLYGGAGIDDLYGEGGADTFIFDAASTTGDVDNLYDFNAFEGDMIDITDILQSYDPLTDAIADFVQITDNGTDSFVAVDADGGADNFITIAQLYGVTGLDAETLETDGNLITTV